MSYYWIYLFIWIVKVSTRKSNSKLFEFQYPSLSYSWSTKLLRTNENFRDSGFECRCVSKRFKFPQYWKTSNYYATEIRVFITVRVYSMILEEERQREKKGRHWNGRTRVCHNSMQFERWCHAECAAGNKWRTWSLEAELN